jgi:NADH-quinone oxidoreductase subunit L
MNALANQFSGLIEASPFTLALVPNLIATALAMPLVAFVVLAASAAFGAKLAERTTAWLIHLCFGTAAAAAMLASVLGALLAAGPISLHLPPLFRFGGESFALDFRLDLVSTPFFVLTALLSGVIGAFSHRYLHREPGGRRFFMLLALFAFGMQLIVLSTGVDLLFVGWELVGVTSALLIAFFHERASPVRHGFWAFGFYRACDVGLLSAAVMLHHHGGSGMLVGYVPSVAEAGLLGALLVFASMAKSAQFPFGSWLPRAMEGPTPSSAIFYGALSLHAGSYLLLRTASLWQPSPWVPWLIVAIGGVTALHGTVVGRVQSDIKSTLAYAAMTQSGLIFVEIGLGLHGLALLHVVGHSFLRTLQLLRAPSLMHDHHRLEQAIGSHLPRTGLHYERWLPVGLQNRLYRHALHRWHLDTLILHVVGARVRALVGGLDWLDRRLAGILGAAELAEPTHTPNPSNEPDPAQTRPVSSAVGARP